MEGHLTISQSRKTWKPSKSKSSVLQCASQQTSPSKTIIARKDAPLKQNNTMAWVLLFHDSESQVSEKSTALQTPPPKAPTVGFCPSWH